MLQFNYEEVLNIIKILRGNNDISDNCTHVSNDLMEYFKTEVIPTKESITTPSTIEDFDVVTMTDWIKKENGSKYLGVIKSIVHLNNTKINNIPYNRELLQLSDGTLDLENYVHDLDHYTQYSSHITEINECLKIKAKENQLGISFGFICVARCGKYINIAGHMLVYFANTENVWYIDCQLYNGENKVDNGCIFNNLSSKYQFANVDKIDIDTFGEYVFYIPIGPKTIIEMEVVPVKLEEEIIQNNKKLNEYICQHNIKRSYCRKCTNNRARDNRLCEHDRVRSQCKECGGGSICEHNRVRSQCKECGGGSICEHNRIRSKCKECKGGSICEHNKRKSTCKECKGGSICEHDRIRSKCKECKGGSICEHNRQRSLCKECKGSSVCKHNHIRSTCKDCKGSQICEHNRRKSQCKDCKGSEICKHGRRKSNCKNCKGSSICEHNRQKSKCKDCKGSSICQHNRQKWQCKECKGSQICEHNRQKSTCKECKLKRKSDDDSILIPPKKRK